MALKAGQTDKTLANQESSFIKLTERTQEFGKEDHYKEMETNTEDFEGISQRVCWLAPFGHEVLQL